MTKYESALVLIRDGGFCVHIVCSDCLFHSDVNGCGMKGKKEYNKVVSAAQSYVKDVQNNPSKHLEELL